MKVKLPLSLFDTWEGLIAQFSLHLIKTEAHYLLIRYEMKQESQRNLDFSQEILVNKSIN